MSPHSLLLLLSLVWLLVASETASAGMVDAAPVAAGGWSPAPTFLADSVPDVANFEPWLRGLLILLAIVYVSVKCWNECRLAFGRKPAVSDDIATIKDQLAELREIFLTREDGERFVTREELTRLELTTERAIVERLDRIDSKRSEQVAALHKKMEDMPAQVLAILRHTKVGRS